VAETYEADGWECMGSRKPLISQQFKEKIVEISKGIGTWLIETFTGQKALACYAILLYAVIAAFVYSWLGIDPMTAMSGLVFY